MKLSILIPTLPERFPMLNNLVEHLGKQAEKYPNQVEILIDDRDKGVSTGRKRNDLLKKAKGYYIVFIDDDDEVPEYYIDEILKASEQNADCIATNGKMTTNGGNEIKWKLSKNYENADAYENGVKYYQRKINHISPIKRELALQVGFPDISNAEDKYYSDRIAPLCKTESVIDLPMYWYKFSTYNKSY